MFRIIKNKMNWFKKTKKLSEVDLLEFSELNRLVGSEKYKLMAIKNNTALIPMGKQLMRQQEVLVQLIENQKNNWISVKLSELGIPKGLKVNISIKDGLITIVGESDDIIRERELKKLQTNE